VHQKLAVVIRRLLALSLGGGGGGEVLGEDGLVPKRDKARIMLQGYELRYTHREIDRHRHTDI